MAKRTWDGDKDKKLRAAEERLRKIRASLQKLKRSKIKSERQIRAERLHALGSIVETAAASDAVLRQKLRELVRQHGGAHAEAFSGTIFDQPAPETKPADSQHGEASSELSVRRTLSLKGAN